MTLSLKQLVRRGFTTRQAKALIENTPEAPAAFPEHFANPTGDVAGLTAVLPYVGSYTSGGTYDFYAGLVTVAADAPAPPTNWYLVNVDTPLTATGIANGNDSETGAGGALIGVYDPPAGSPAPTALPEGWTAGNTTGSGPALPKIAAHDFGSGAYRYTDYYAGLVTVEAGSVAYTADTETWYLEPADTPLTFDGVRNATQATDPVAPGVYLAVYEASSAATDGARPAPTTFPDGWSFQPYGVGAAGPVLAALGEAVGSDVKPAQVYLATEGTPSGGAAQVFSYPGLDDTVAVSMGPLDIPPGGRVCRAQIKSPNDDDLLIWSELWISNAAGTQTFIAYQTAGIPLEAGAVLNMADAHFDAPIKVGTDLTAADDAEGRYEVHSTAGGVFWVTWYVTVGKAS